MIFNISKNIKFSLFYKKLNILSLILIALSISFLLFKGLNLGVDFKGGTLIEIRTENPNIVKMYNKFNKILLILKHVFKVKYKFRLPKKKKYCFTILLTILKIYYFN